MKPLALFLSLLLFVQLALYPLPILASVTYSDGGAQGEASVNKIGKLLLAQGIATLTATTIEVSSQDSSGNKNTQLKGRLFKSDKFGSTVKGLAYFNEGPGLSDLDASSCNEHVVKIDGSKISGKVTDVTDSTLTCGGTSIALDQVSKIHSARVFKYTTGIGEKPKMNFTATCVKAKASGNKLSTKRKIIIGTVAVCLIVGIACGVAIPLAVAGGRRGGGHPPVFIAPAPAPRASHSDSSYP